MESSSRNKIVIVVVGVVVIALVVFAVIVLSGAKKTQQPGTPGTTTTVTTSTSGTGPTTRLPVPADVVVPNAGGTSTNGMAVPQVQAPAAQDTTSQYRRFDLTVQDGKFTPDTIAVNLGDVVSIQMSAVGGNYDFTQPDFGLSAILPSGATKKIQFGALSVGKFIFYCASCGGPAKGPVGYIIIKGN